MITQKYNKEIFPLFIILFAGFLYSAEQKVYRVPIQGVIDLGLPTFIERVIEEAEKDQVEVMEKLGFSSYHVVGHDRGARVGLRLALDFPDRVLSFTPLDVVPSETAFRNMNSDLSFAWFHWHLMRQPYPLPETLIGNSAKVYLDFLFERWTAIEGAITNEAYQEYLRCFNNTETIRSTCLDYRSVEQDILHDQLDLKNKLKCPVLVLWAGNMQKRKGWQTGNVLNMIDVWKEIKLATNEICISKGGTVTHHHAVGRDHRPNGYDNQRPDLFKEILTAAKYKVDPNGIMNPGVLIDPENKNIDNWLK